MAFHNNNWTVPSRLIEISKTLCTYYVDVRLALLQVFSIFDSHICMKKLLFSIFHHNTQPIQKVKMSSIWNIRNVHLRNRSNVSSLTDKQSYQHQPFEGIFLTGKNRLI